MPFSTQTQLQSNVKIIENTLAAGDLVAFATERIALADSIIEIDCGRYIDFSLVPTIGSSPDTPGFVNLLSQYKSAEMALVRLSSSIRKNTEMHDITYWQQLYDDLKQKIADGAIDLELSDGTIIGKSGNTFRQRSKKNIEPYMGQGKQGRFADEDLQEDQRESDDGAF